MADDYSGGALLTRYAVDLIMAAVGGGVDVDLESAHRLGQKLLTGNTVGVFAMASTLMILYKCKFGRGLPLTQKFFLYVLMAVVFAIIYEVITMSAQFLTNL